MPHAPRLAAFLQQLRGAFRREELPPPSDEPAPAPRRGVLGLLFTLEPLPRDPAPAAPARRGLLAAVFAPEALPLDPEAPPRQRARWLAWLLAPEPIDGESTGPEVH
jgi:hypothetical protein